MIKLGVYGKCAHPTCTTLVFLVWIIFCIIPDLRIFILAIWFTAVTFFWMRAEKAFFLGRKYKFEEQDSRLG